MKDLKFGLLGLIALLGALAQPSSAGGTCDQPYFPVRSGSTWTYTTNLSVGKSSTHTVTIENVTDKSFTQHQVFGSGTTTNALEVRTNWSCGPNGLTSSQTQNNTVTTKSTQVNAQVIRQSGVVIPANLGVGSSWTFSQLSSMKMGGQTLEIPSEASFKAIGMESVTVKAGTFTTLKVTATTKITMPGSKEATETTQTIWYARGVGMVKTLVGSGTTTELVSYKI